MNFKRKPITNLTFAMMAFFVVSTSATAGGVLFVDDDAPAAGDGTSWDTAYRFLQDALTDASLGDVFAILIAQGTYKPDRDEANPKGTGDRQSTFQLINDVVLMGGYAGIGAEDPDLRDIILYETIFSGDLLGNDEADFVNNEENSFHVMMITTKDAIVSLNGITITSGNANDPGNPHGGGLFCDDSDPLLTDCIFTNNFSGNHGSAISARSTEMFVNGCSFINNTGVSTIQVASGTTSVADCLFLANHGVIGGAIYGSQAAYVYIERSTFLENTATSSGGALNLINVVMFNSLFVGNSTTNGDGGAMRLSGSNTGNFVINCTIANNSAGDEGGAIDFLESSSNDTLSITNTIIWGNSDSSGDGEGSQIHQGLKGILDINYSCIQGLTGNFGGIGNIGDDPLFVDPIGPDKMPGTADDDLHLANGSPCANRANPLTGTEIGFTDIDGEPRVQVCRLDIGADESAYFFSDCNENGLADACDLADFTSTDCNNNGILDECDIAQNFSEDCNNNGFPDECDVDPVLYRVDDGSSENPIGLLQGGELIWLNKFTALRDNETIIAIDITWGIVDEGTLTDLAIWIDPSNDGDPTDAQLIMLLEIPATNVSCAQFNTIEIPPTLVGNKGDVFFVGAHMTQVQGEYPACIDQTPPSQLSSWAVEGDNLEQLWNNPMPPELIDDICCVGNWLIRARRLGSDDADENGVPDECNCPWDLDKSGSVGISDLLELFAQWGTAGAADFDESGTVDTADLLILFANWGPCPS